MSAEGSQFRLLHDGSMWRQEIAKTNCFDVSTTINVGDLADYYKTIYLTHSVECIICGTNTNNTGCLMLFCISLVKSYGSLMQPLLVSYKTIQLCACVFELVYFSTEPFRVPTLLLLFYEVGTKCIDRAESKHTKLKYLFALR